MDGDEDDGKGKVRDGGDCSRFCTLPFLWLIQFKSYWVFVSSYL